MRETPNFLTNADSSMNIFVSAGAKMGLIAFFLPTKIYIIFSAQREGQGRSAPVHGRGMLHTSPR